MARTPSDKRYLPISTAGAAQALTSARKAMPWASAATFPIEPVTGSARVSFFGTVNNATCDVHVWGVIYGRGNGKPETDFRMEYLGKAAIVIGNTPGCAGSAATDAPVGSAELMADTIVWTPSTTATTPKGPMSVLETAMNEGVAAAYSPANDTPAHLVLPSLGRFHGLIFEFAVASSGLVNALVHDGE